MLVHSFPLWQVGLLDVFGFESLETNSLEQLCINYANESMHALYLGHVFQGSELDDHLIESLLGEDAGRLDNRPCLALIEAPPNGVLHLLDHQCKAPASSEESFCIAVNVKHRDSAFFTVHTPAEGCNPMCPGCNPIAPGQQPYVRRCPSSQRPAVTTRAPGSSCGTSRGT